jgi:hypothetical protein
MKSPNIGIAMHLDPELTSEGAFWVGIRIAQSRLQFNQSRCARVRNLVAHTHARSRRGAQSWMKTLIRTEAPHVALMEDGSSLCAHDPLRSRAAERQRSRMRI